MEPDTGAHRATPSANVRRRPCVPRYSARKQSRPCFFEPPDYGVYLGLLRELVQDMQCAVHAYVLMSNHVHLLMTPETADAPSRLMQQLSRRYSCYVNRRYERSGSLWEGRFWSSMVTTDSYRSTKLCLRRYAMASAVKPTRNRCQVGT